MQKKTGGLTPEGGEAERGKSRQQPAQGAFQTQTRELRGLSKGKMRGGNNGDQGRRTTEWHRN